MIPRPLLVALLLLPAVAAGAPRAGAAGYVAIEKIPGSTPVTVLVREKPRVYFRVTSNAPLAVPIDGPARVRVVSRVECATAGVVTYRVMAAEAGSMLDHLDTESSASPDVRLEKGNTPLGKSRRLTFDLPEGRHRVTFSLTGASAALLRIQTSAGSAPQPMVSLTPVAAERSVNVAEGEKLIPYYTVVPGKPVRIRVVGPTALELSTRLDFDATMRGTQAYRLRLSEQGKTLREVEIKTTKAVAASYEKVRDRVPSKLDITRLQIPDGTHEIAVELLQPARGTAQVHARIPEPSVGAEE